MSEVTSARLEPGTLSALLVELAREAPRFTGWEQPLVAGERVGRFEVLREIGRGGFGVVYEARDLELGRSVALKTVRTDGTTDAGALAEAESAARLSHPGIVTLHDVGRTDRGVFLVMELLRGRTLASRLTHEPLPPREALRILRAVTLALAHAHAAGVVHRDLSPGNVFLCDDGAVKVLDFGLARAFGANGPAAGTEGYIAPEQERGGAADARSDVFALGALVDALFAAGSPTARVRSQALRLRERLCAADPAQRPADGAAALKELAPLAAAVEPPRRRWVWAGLATVGALNLAWWTLGAAPALPQGRLRLVLSGTTNTTGDARLDGTASALAIALEGSPRYQLAPAGADPRSAHATLAVALQPVGGELEVQARVTSPQDGRLLFSVRDRAGGPGALPDALDRVAGQLRDWLDDPTPRDQRPRLAAYVPLDPAALHAFLEGERLAAQASWDAAERAYRRALELDARFPLAHARLATLMQWRDAGAMQEHLTLAASQLDRLPPKERTWVEAERAFLMFEDSPALARYERGQTLWPDEPRFVRGVLAVVLSRWSELASARAPAERLLALGARTPAEEVQLRLILGDAEGAVRQARAWAEMAPGRPSWTALSVALRTRGDTEAALAAARRAVDHEPGPLSPSLFWTFVEADRLDEAEAAGGPRGAPWQSLVLRGKLRAALAAFDGARQQRPGAPAMSHAMFHNERADLLWTSGDPARLWHEIQKQLEYGTPAAACGAMHLLSHGDLEHADRLLALWPQVERRQRCYRVPALLRAWRTGQLDAAIPGLRALFDPLARYHLALALMDAGRDEEAISELRAFRRWPERQAPGDGYLVGMYPATLAHEAVALERLGRRDEAVHVLRRLDTLWREADPDLPLVRPARAQLQRLTAQEARR